MSCVKGGMGQPGYIEEITTYTGSGHLRNLSEKPIPKVKAALLELEFAISTLSLEQCMRIRLGTHRFL